MSKIYKVTNKENGKFYIGRTSYKKLYMRKASHKWYANHMNTNLPFPNALRKYGVDGFVWEILEECDDNKAGEREMYYILELNPQYNATLGGGRNFWSSMSRTCKGGNKTIKNCTS